MDGLMGGGGVCVCVCMYEWVEGVSNAVLKKKPYRMSHRPTLRAAVAARGAMAERALLCEHETQHAETETKKTRQHCPPTQPVNTHIHQRTHTGTYIIKLIVRFIRQADDSLPV